MKTKIWSEISISNFPMKHEELTEFLGIEPTEAENAGDICYHPNGKSFVLKISSWTLESGCDKFVDFETQINSLLDKIRPYKDRFIKICEKYPLDLSIYIHTSEHVISPYIGWESEVMKELAEYNASWGIDLSIYKEGEDDE
jgi:hypothetical protein